MSVKLKYDKKEDIPAGMETMYVEKDGAWLLQVEGMVPAAELSSANDRLAEFRTNNISLSQSLKELEGKKFLSQEEQEEFDELKKQADDIRDKNLIDSGKIEELLASRTERMRSDYDNQINGFKTQLKKANTTASTFEGRLSNVLVEAEVGKVLSAGGFLPVQGALSDIVSRARGMWKVNEAGDLVALDGNGNAVYGQDPQTPLSMAEWASTTVKEAPYLFMENKGSGGKGNDRGGDKGSDGVIRISRSDENAKSQHIAELATGKAVLVD